MAGLADEAVTSEEGFPFNWVPLREGSPSRIKPYKSNSTRFPFNWVPLREGSQIKQMSRNSERLGFHSIGFPCERGVLLLF